MATNTTSDVPGAVSSEISLPALLSAEGEDFVRLAYRAVLGREVDHSGEAYYNDRLRQGYSKLEILGQLRKSKEAAGRESVANLDEVLGRQGILRLALGRRRAAEILEGRIISKPFNIHVNHFMRYHDEEFVTQIFQFYLGRKPDGPGLAYYLNQLRAGKSRQQLLLDVARSREARARGAKAAGQTSVAIALAADQIPVVRTLVAIARFNLRIRQHLRDMRALQNHLYRVSKSLH